MHFTYSEIIILGISALLIFSIGLIFYFLYKRKIKNTGKELILERARLLDEIDYLKREISRLNYVQSKSIFSASKESSISNLNKTSNSLQLVESNQSIELASDSGKFDDEKQKFKEKSKKLWEQSIAIHKEKERIDILKKDIEARHKEVTSSINYAKRIQNALIPNDDILKRSMSEYFVFWRPLNIVSGDFYWIKQYGKNVVFVVADCTGHGVPGAFMSALGISFLNEIVSKQENLTADQILGNLRELVKTSLNQSDSNFEMKDGMDMALCIFNPQEKKLSFAGANNPLFLFRNGEIIEYPATRNPIGVYKKEKAFETIEIAVNNDDKFYMFSDGFADEFGGEKGRKMKKDGFKNILIEMNLKEIPISEQNLFLADKMDEWLGDEYHQIDDILVAGFKI